ncbi:hypothetical protein STAL104432_30215 [Streptomyces albus]
MNRTSRAVCRAASPRIHWRRNAVFPEPESPKTTKCDWPRVMSRPTGRRSASRMPMGTSPSSSAGPWPAQRCPSAGAADTAAARSAAVTSSGSTRRAGGAGRFHDSAIRDTSADCASVSRSTLSSPSTRGSAMWWMRPLPTSPRPGTV